MAKFMKLQGIRVNASNGSIRNERKDVNTSVVVTSKMFALFYREKLGDTSMSLL